MAIQNFKKKSGYKPSGQDAAHQGASAAGGRIKKSPFVKRKICRFCAEKREINYRDMRGDAEQYRRAFITDGGKILSGRITGACAKHQREFAIAVKRARILAYLPFTTNN